jgi:hypothetical protein
LNRTSSPNLNPNPPQTRPRLGWRECVPTFVEAPTTTRTEYESGAAASLQRQRTTCPMTGASRGRDRRQFRRQLSAPPLERGWSQSQAAVRLATWPTT